MLSLASLVNKYIQKLKKRLLDDLKWKYDEIENIPKLNETPNFLIFATPQALR